MKKTAFLTVSLIALTLGAAACAPKVAEPVVEAPPASVAPAPMADMPMPAATAAAEPIVGTGKVVEIDAKAGTIKLDHGPIAALDWPAMSMTFTASDPAILAGVAVGDTVAFDVKSVTESAVVTKVQKQ